MGDQKRMDCKRDKITLYSPQSSQVAEIIRREVNKAMRELSNYRYDPKKYEERVRERRAWEADSGRDADDG